MPESLVGGVTEAYEPVASWPIGYKPSPKGTPAVSTPFGGTQPVPEMSPQTQAQWQNLWNWQHQWYMENQGFDPRGGPIGTGEVTTTPQVIAPPAGAAMPEPQLGAITPGNRLFLSPQVFETLPENIRSELPSFLRQQGFLPTGVFGRYGPQEFAVPQGFRQFQPGVFGNLPEWLRPWISWLFGRLGMAQEVPFGTPAGAPPAFGSQEWLQWVLRSLASQPTGMMNTL